MGQAANVPDKILLSQLQNIQINNWDQDLKRQHYVTTCFSCEWCYNGG